MELQQATSIYGGYHVRKREREEEAERERETREQPAQTLLQHRVHFPDSAEKRPSRLHTRLMHFNKVKVQVIHNRTLTNSHLPITAGMAFESSNPCRGVPTYPITSSHGQRRNRPPPETFRSDSVSRFYKTTRQVKTNSATPPECADKSR